MESTGETWAKPWELAALLAALACIAAFSATFIRGAVVETALPPCRSGNFTQGTCEPDESGFH